MNETLWGVAHLFAWLFELVMVVVMLVLGSKAIRGAIHHFRSPRRARVSRRHHGRLGGWAAERLNAARTGATRTRATSVLTLS